jgi:hypothetical protein
LQYANNVYSRIQDFAKHQQSQVADLAKHRSLMAMQKLNTTMPLLESMMRSPDEKTRQAGRDGYAGIANEIDGNIRDEQNMTSRRYLDPTPTAWIAGDRATGEYTAPNQYYKTLGANEQLPAEPPPQPSVPNNGTPFNNLPAYEPPPQPARVGNIFDQITNPDTTPLMQRDMGENDVPNITGNNAYDPSWNNNVFDQIASKSNGTQFSDNSSRPPYSDSSKPHSTRPQKKKGSA